MGNVPNRWVGRGAALFVAILLGVGGYFFGAAVADRLANGFTFDWFVHPGDTRFPVGDVLPAVGLVAGLAAFLAGGLAVGPTAFATRLWMKRARYSPPQYSAPQSLDVLATRFLVVLPVTLGLLATLGCYILLASPLAQGGVAISNVSVFGYVVLMSWAAAISAGLTALIVALATFSGYVSGKLVPKSDRNIIARISLFGMRNAKTVVALIVGMTLVAGYYATSVNTNVDVADVLPRGDPNTVAAHNLTDKFKSSFTQQVTFQFRVLDAKNQTQHDLYESENSSKLPHRVTNANINNISDELYIRSAEETIAFILTQKPFAGTVGGPDLFKLINWTIAGGNTQFNTAGNASYSLPNTTQEGELQYRLVHDGVTNVGAVYAAVDALASPSWTQMAILVTVDPTSVVTTKEIGEAAIAAREAWFEHVKAGKSEFQVFGTDNPPLFSVDLPLANAHASELTKADFSLLLPIIALFIALTLYIAFRNVVSVVVTFSMLAVAVVWTFGVMGAMKIPLNTLNLAVVPLIMGVGIDYGIHMMNEFQEQRSAGKTPEEAWTEAGGGSALALFVGMLTTAAGLVVMIVSPSLIVSQLGILANVALVACYILAILFIPAMTSLLSRFQKKKARVEYQPSRLMPAFATAVSRGRWFVLLVLVMVAVGSVAAASTIRREAFGDPPRNWLESDPLRQEHEKAIEGFYETATDDVKANVLIFEGDLTNPEAHKYISAITNTLRNNSLNGRWVDPETNETHQGSRVIADTLKDLPFLMNTYLTVRGGVPGAGKFLGAEALAPALAQLNVQDPTGQTKNYPQTAAEMKQVMDEIHASPLYQLQNLFIDYPTYDMTVTIFSVRAATYADAEEVWHEVMAAVKTHEALKPADMHTAFFGNTAINYLFVAKQVPWLGYMSIATVILVIIIVFAFTRDFRATLAVGTLNFLTSAMWLGALTLPFIDIGLAITLTLPLIFIFAMGSDYGLHLSMRCKKTKDTYETFEGVGKGVLFSFITTFGSFLIFTQVSDLAGRRSMIATSIAIAVVFLVTLALIPIIFPVKKHQRKGERNRNVPLVNAHPTAVNPAAPAAPTGSIKHQD